jgi:competence protein ComEA
MRNIKTVITIFTVIAVIMGSFGSVWASETAKININKASVEELVQLQKIGPKYAERIVAFRDANGPFQTPEDIMKVPGIGPKTFEKNKDLISVE